MPKVHDRGGWPNDDPIDHDEHEMEEWERQVDALNGVLGDKGLKNTDQLRRAIESLDLKTYESLAYYEKWTAAMEMLLVEQGVMTKEEIDAKMSSMQHQQTARAADVLRVHGQCECPSVAVEAFELCNPCAVYLVRVAHGT